MAVIPLLLNKEAVMASQMRHLDRSVYSQLLPYIVKENMFFGEKNIKVSFSKEYDPPISVIGSAILKTQKPYQYGFSSSINSIYTETNIDISGLCVKSDKAYASSYSGKIKEIYGHEYFEISGLNLLSNKNFSETSLGTVKVLGVRGFADDLVKPNIVNILFKRES